MSSYSGLCKQGSLMFYISLIPLKQSPLEQVAFIKSSGYTAESDCDIGHVIRSKQHRYFVV